ncbi:MAG: tRNA1(Val) (adenine(37)-N6)-methyltransferase [Clostridia bacterium]|nr:tRNA1(Val) (adenine(37)-N6)-methyltransferase [Clostridia bacterium]
MSLRIDDLQINNLKLIQDKSLFCFGTDAVLLANFAKPLINAEILDIGTGNGIIPVLLSAKVKAKHITGIEIQQESFLLAQKNIELNSLGGLVSVVLGDVRQKECLNKQFNYITCNPPYKMAGTGIENPKSPLAIARHELTLTLDDVFSRAEKLLVSKGKIAMVHKPERLAEIFYTMNKYKIEPKRLQLVYSTAKAAEPSLVLVEGAKDGGKGIRYEKNLYVYDENGNYTANINDLYNKTLKEDENERA